MAIQRMEAEDQEALFSSSPCTALYYVQSPSTASHAIRHPSSESSLLSPFEANRNREASRCTLSRYSSSRGSNNSHVSVLKSGKLKIVNKIGEDVEYDDEEPPLRRNGLWRFIALDPTSSCCCLMFQILWRFLLSVGFALLLFFLITKPPSPKVSFEIVGLKQFSLSEGLDNTGVVTNIFSSNCSIDMVIDNNSKVFGLHIHPPSLEMAFGRLKLTQSKGSELYVESKSSYVKRLHVGVKDRPVYGAGRRMQDMLESGQGLPLMVRVRSRSSYRVVWNLIKLRYLHHEECLLVLGGGEKDRKQNIRIHNSTCSSNYQK
ncbi:uncharacterized protein LOC109822570 [Asparagus officinalis]|uniref:uncharacterized protein LOC109822570 n=1 Tax=Asparagus officinalis TaxID=4686 RepID=UPI00098E4A94|nr:uncharacterized protein LOC109822570 [Asparagus officinalis]